MKMAEKPERDTKGWTNYSAGALEMGVSVVIGLALGAFIDSLLGTAPWMAVTWMCFGTIAGVRSLYRLAKRLEREAEEEENQAADDDNSRS